MARQLPFLYAKIDVNYSDHPKIVELSADAFRTHIEMILYARKYLTDGRIPKQLAKRWLAVAINELLENDDESPSLTRDENGDLWLHDFVAMQTSKADAGELSEVRALAGRAGGRVKAQNAKQSAKQNARQTGKQNSSQSESESESSKNKTNTLPPPPKNSGTRLPDDWQPNADLIDFVRAECPNVNGRTATENFRDYWHSKSGKDATRTKWDLVYRKWMRTEQERAPRLRAAQTKSTTDDRVRGHLALAAEFAARETNTDQLEITS